MKRMMHGGNKTRRGVSLLLILSILLALLPAASIADTATTGAYGSCTVTYKNVVMRVTAAGPRTGYFAQKGTYPMIGPVVMVDGVPWYNIRTSSTSGYVSGKYATASYGSAGMPATTKSYVDILNATTLTKGADPLHPVKDAVSGDPVTVSVPKGTILQLEDGKSYTISTSGTSVEYINVYYNYEVYHTLYTNDFTKGVMSQDNLNDYISGVTWKLNSADLRQKGAKGDYLTHAVQAALYLLEYYDGEIDGSYGDETADAVQEFKEDMIEAHGYSWTPNGVLGSACYKDLFSGALARLEYLRTTDGLGGTPGGTTPGSTKMVQTTVNGLRIRKSYTTSSPYIGKIETSGTILTYTRTHVNGTVTWYYIQHNGTYGWIMGTYVNEYTPPTGGGTTPPVITNYGTLKITKKLVAIRTSANGPRSGYHVNTGDICTMIGPSVEAGGYTWYHIRTENGRTGYVRGDCAEANFDSSAGMPKTTKNYVQFLYTGMKVTPGSKPSEPKGAPQEVPQNTVLQMIGSSYKEGGVEYVNVYYKNTICFTPYTNDLTKGLMNDDNLNDYIINVVWSQGLAPGDVAANDETKIRTGDIRVHAIQAALYQLKYLDDSDKYDGIFGSDTGKAVEKFKKAYKSSITTVNKSINSDDSVVLFSAAAAALKAKLTEAGGGSDPGDGTVPSSGDFGTVVKVKRGSWAEIDGGSRSLFPKGTVVTVMSVKTKQVFRLYRWSGANHADCVPYSTADTATICAVLGMAYNASAPSSRELSLIKASGNQDWPDYTWPKMRWDGKTLSNAYKIPVWVNMNGTVYCASIYIIPHGFTGSSSFSLSKLNGQYFYERNNMYGMLCVHFYGSTTHASGKVDATHMTNINYAYNSAASYFGAGKVQ